MINICVFEIRQVHTKARGYSAELQKWLLQRLAFRDEGMSEAAVLLAGRSAALAEHE